jgi:hypothetical protein
MYCLHLTLGAGVQRVERLLCTAFPALAGLPFTG